MQYSNTTQQDSTSAPGAFTKLQIATDRNSNGSSDFTKSSSTDIQCNFNGYVTVSYSANLQNTINNDRPGRLVIVKNSTELSWTSRNCASKINAGRYYSISGTFVISVINGDTISLGWGNAEELADTIRIHAEEASLLVRKELKS